MINAGRVQKRKILEDFENELKVKGVEDRQWYENHFRTILNGVYKHSFRDIRPNITRFKTLSVLLMKEHMFIFIEVDKKNPNTLLTITMTEDVEKGGHHIVTLEDALRKIDHACRMKV